MSRRRVFARWIVTSIVAGISLFAVNSASADIVINEVDSDPTDFIELYNTGASSVDISGYMLKDSNDGNSFPIPGGTTIAAGGFYSVNGGTLGFELAGDDEARVFAPGGSVLLDSFVWTSPVFASYGRCPDGTGALGGTESPTRASANDCFPAGTPWPGGDSVTEVDGVNVFGRNLSGLAYQPSGTSGPGVLWAVRDNPSTLFRLVWNGTQWTPDTANGWAAGKALHYPGGTGAPDAEGVTLADDDPNAVYVSTERNDDGVNSNTSRPAILRFDVSGASASLDATKDFNLTADIPALDANAGLEAIAWVPDSLLVSKGFIDESTGVAYDPADYPNHGTGIFFVGVEQNGQIIGYALDLTNGLFNRVTTIASGFPTIVDLSYTRESTHLWAVCDNSCNGLTKTLDVVGGNFAATDTYARPALAPNLHNEGFAIAPRAECVNGRKPVFYADDSNDNSHALRAGTINCTASGGGGGGSDTTVDGSASAKSKQRQRGKKIAVKVTVSSGEALTADAGGRIKAGRGRSYTLKPVSQSVPAAGSSTLKLKPAKSKDARKIAKFLDKGKKAKASVSVILTDTAGNTKTEALKAKLTGKSSRRARRTPSRPAQAAS